MDPSKRRRRPSLATGDGGAEGTPPRKRPRPADADEPPSPKWRLLRHTVLVVFFLIRAKDAADGVSQIGRVVREELCRCLAPVFSKLKSIEQHIQDLTHKVNLMQNQITPARPRHINQKQPMNEEANKERTNAEGLATNEGEASSTSVRLRFLNEMKPPVYHDDEIKAENNKAIRIAIFDGDQIIKSGPLSKVRIEILALEGNFPYGITDSWTSVEFNEHIACGRDGKGNVLAGQCNVQLINGEVSLDTIKFKEGSCRARRGMFVLAARVRNGARTDGVPVQEAVMKPVVVQDRRNKSNGKSHPPKLDDKVHRLEEIANDGIYCKRLEEKGIVIVEHFLKALNKDPDNLANILHIKKEHKAWEKMVTHARECCLDGKHELKSYRDAQRKVVLFFNCVHFLVGAAFDGRYIASDKLNSAQQFVVDKLKERAYQMLDDLPFDHIMEGDFPILNPMNANAGGHHAAHRVQGTEAVEGLDHAQIEPSCANENNQSTLQAGQEQFPTSSGAAVCHIPIAQLNFYQSNGFYPESDDFELEAIINDFYKGIHSVTPGSAQVDVEFQLQTNMFVDDENFEICNGGSAQVNMQSQMQAALPGNGPSEASTSTSNLPPQQWPQTQ